MINIISKAQKFKIIKIHMFFKYLYNKKPYESLGIEFALVLAESKKLTLF